MSHHIISIKDDVFRNLLTRACIDDKLYLIPELLFS